MSDMPGRKKKDERRAHPRVSVRHGSAALVSDHGLKMGRLVDISRGGAGFTCLVDDNGLKGRTGRVNIMTPAPLICLENFPCTVVYDHVIIPGDEEGRPLRRCGLQFQELSPSQRSQLADFIHGQQQQTYDPHREDLEKQLLKSEEKYRNILESITEGYFEVDIAGNVTFFNNPMLKTIGYGADELLGMNYRNFMSRETAQRVFKEYNQAYRTGILPVPFDWALVKKNGAVIQVETSMSFIKNGQDKIIGFRGIARDISPRKKIEQELLYMASHDQLTGLYNRGALFEKLRENISYARRFNKKCALLFMDLDNFKTVNDRFGHTTGDQVLKEVALRLSASLRETDYICRHGGDEFTIVLNNADNIDPVMVARKIIKNISAPYHIAGQSIDFVSGSIGICLYPDDGVDMDTLISCADKAMYRAKEEKNSYICYSRGQYTQQQHLISA